MRPEAHLILFSLGSVVYHSDQIRALNNQSDLGPNPDFTSYQLFNHEKLVHLHKPVSLSKRHFPLRVVEKIKLENYIGY